MTDKELCTQYEFIVKMIKKGNYDDVVEILENAIRRIDKGMNTGSQKEDNKD